MLIIGHRGIPSRIHENTLESFIAAAQSGADLIELDIRRTADEVAVAFHDPDIQTNDGATPIASLTYAELQRKANALGFAVPTISETIKALSKLKGILFEFKEPGYEQSIIENVCTFYSPSQVAFQSFDYQIVTRLKERNPDLYVGLLLEKESELNNAEAFCGDFLAPSLELFRNNRSFFTEQKRRSRHLAVWTVNAPDQLQTCLADPLLDMLITNRCDLARSLSKEISR